MLHELQCLIALWSALETSGATPRIADVTIRNVDGTHNEMGKIRYKTKICYNLKRNQFEDWFYITKLGNQKVILGLPWLKQVNPDIDWSIGTVSFPEERSINDDPEGEGLEDDETDMYLLLQPFFVPTSSVSSPVYAHLFFYDIVKHSMIFFC